MLTTASGALVKEVKRENFKLKMSLFILFNTLNAQVPM